ncbi:unnamed protein product [Heligmosomoides polygyrus]|uniref:phosphoinositide phospholipase C n=1 Tax=Heligmosomoides polygyrus TaxID=6339 RepID=A0A3P8A5M0_HELPZ|nr:unnamed protein product [Heligmosomoides polygyrus]
MVQTFRETFGDRLLADPLDSHPLAEGQLLPSPHALKYKIIIKAKKAKPVKGLKKKESDSCGSFASEGSFEGSSQSDPFRKMSIPPPHNASELALLDKEVMERQLCPVEEELSSKDLSKIVNYLTAGKVPQKWNVDRRFYLMCSLSESDSMRAYTQRQANNLIKHTSRRYVRKPDCLCDPSLELDIYERRVPHRLPVTLKVTVISCLFLPIETSSRSSSYYVTLDLLDFPPFDREANECAYSRDTTGIHTSFESKQVVFKKQEPRGSSVPLTLTELDSVTSVVSLHLSLEFTFIFASEHHVNSIEEHSRDGILKISCDGIHNDNKEESRKGRTLVYPDRDGNLHRGFQLELWSLDKSREFALTL